jgi:prepilin-type N-terminal cleavage/methylation domain-containing protein
MQEATPSSTRDGESSGDPDQSISGLLPEPPQKILEDMYKRKTGSMSKRGMRGFSLVEMMIVVTILLIMCGISFMTLQPALKQLHITNAYNTTLATMRLARQMAIGKRDVYTVTFNSAVVPNTITITDLDPVSPKVVETVTIPSDIAFTTVTGIPSTVATTPDHFGLGSVAIDFDQGITPGVPTVIYFMPDGSAQDAGNNINNGVIYVARPGVIMSSKAITLWGATGRIRGWRLDQNASLYQWNQQ